MAIISKKKEIFPISPVLRSYIKKYDREIDLPIYYGDLLRYDNSIPLYDKAGNDTLWETVFFPQSDMTHINASLKKVYAIIKANGDLSVMDHLIIDRVDLCAYGNTQPFRIRVVNQINDNFDYFYIKNADASRIYGLELEHLLSPNKISYVVNKETLIEEHIVGVPAELFIKKYLGTENLNEIRLAKEFVKFNERCFVRLLGDMHSSNFVIDITPDFEDVEYRLRAIDFDQQSYEGRRAIYLPQYYTQNNPIIKIGLKHMTPETMRQYQREERSNIANRLRVERKRVDDLLSTMKKDQISKPENIKKLRKELADYYEEEDFLSCTCMGDLVDMSLQMLTRKPSLYKDY
ncbi:MAG: hypothetical protein HRT61_09520 [Ekhidna sp.]|nr:hypothetical protein [Ekhidna sp.]